MTSHRLPGAVELLMDRIGIAGDERGVPGVSGERRAKGKMIEQPKQPAFVAEQWRCFACGSQSLIEIAPRRKRGGKNAEHKPAQTGMRSVVKPLRRAATRR